MMQSNHEFIETLKTGDYGQGITSIYRHMEDKVKNHFPMNEIPKRIFDVVVLLESFVANTARQFEISITSMEKELNKEHVNQNCIFHKIDKQHSHLYSKFFDEYTKIDLTREDPVLDKCVKSINEIRMLLAKFVERLMYNDILIKNYSLEDINYVINNFILENCIKKGEK